jgi:hypothetical protein
MSSSTPSGKPLARPAAAAAGALAAGAAPASSGRTSALGSGRLRSDFTRPPSAAGRATPLRGGKETPTPGGGSALLLTPSGIPSAPYDAATPASFTQAGGLYGGYDEAAGSMTSALRAREQQQQQQQHAQAQQHVQAQQHAQAQAAAAAYDSAPGRKPGALAPALRTQGDLWVAPDQDEEWEDVALEVRAPTQALCAGEGPAAAGGPGGGAATAAATGAPPPQAAPLVLPVWLRTRPFSACLALAEPAPLEAEADGEPAPDLRALPEAAREAALVDDLLYAFMGVPGRCIRPGLVEGAALLHGPALAFAPVAALDERSAELVRKLLPLPEYAAVVERFVATRDRWAGPGAGPGWAACSWRGPRSREGGALPLFTPGAAPPRPRSPERGMVVEALASELRSLLEKWRLLVVQLERRALGPGGLSLSELLFQCQAPMASLKLAAEIAVGGAAGAGGGGRRARTRPGGARPYSESAAPAHQRPRSPTPCCMHAQADAASQELTSAGLLNLLHHRLGALGGDAAGRTLVERLLAAAVEPYFEILGGWLSTGVLDDPYNEFMVKVRPAGEGWGAAAQQLRLAHTG